MSTAGKQSEMKSGTTKMKIKILLSVIFLMAGCLHTVKIARDEDDKIQKVSSWSEYTVLTVDNKGVEVIDTKGGPGISAETLSFLKELVMKTAEKVETRWDIGDDQDRDEININVK